MKQQLPYVAGIVVGLVMLFYGMQEEPDVSHPVVAAQEEEKREPMKLDIPPLEDIIADMRTGETGWTTPWMLCTDGETIMRLNEHATIHEDRGGTVQLHVEKTLEGYAVQNYDEDYKWTTGHCEGARYAKVVSFIQH